MFQWKHSFESKSFILHHYSSQHLQLVYEDLELDLDLFHRVKKERKKERNKLKDYFNILGK